MTDLHEPLSRLGLAQYIEKFQEEGFETWETLLDITESDLDTLGVKLGHRRLLQKEIAQTRGLSIEQLSSPTGSRPAGDGRGADNRVDGRAGTGVGGKRKYRRHPKADENAPERAPSAYVIFSNKIREVLKPANLSFTAIAKRVGERWQQLSAEEKEPFELEASAAKEKYHADMAEYKTTRSYREYQQYLAEFKAKASSTSDGKRPKLEKVESTASSGSLGSGSQFESQEPSSASTDLRERRYDSMSSVGPYSSASGLPSPASVASSSTALPGGISTIVPPRNPSPLPTSPSIASSRRLSSNGPSLYGTAGLRPSMDTCAERVGTPGLNQHLPRTFLDGSRDRQTAQGSVSGPSSDSRLARRRTSPIDQQRRSNRIPTLLQHNTSDSSSKSSIASTVSSASTAPSSLFPTGTVDEEKRATMSLPPLANITANTPGGSYLDSAANHYHPPLTRRAAASFGPQRFAESPFKPSQSTGMKFESLQLPLPYNISFGQYPQPRPQQEGKLANIFDLQDLPRERNSLGNLTLDHEVFPTPTSSRSLPSPWQPAHQPSLPSLPSMSCDDSQDPLLRPDADPLSVLAYAGRMLGRDHRPPSSERH
ncbi:hypothetical protein N7G274_001534 [Stereocaulon virgatum]|uniref:HMG box domain-containing protein n=1 Tax=Stereocaulon virgatum TaxID=373712 RepID=A0ABR4AJY6_9LECA